MIIKMPTNDSFYEFLNDPEFLALVETENDDFSEYLWMENEEEFDKMELQKLEEEELIKECLECMLVDELEEELLRIEEIKAEQISNLLASLNIVEADVENSKLNPLAEEFIPSIELLLETATA